MYDAEYNNVNMGYWIGMYDLEYWDTEYGILSMGYLVWGTEYGVLNMGYCTEYAWDTEYGILSMG